jgi:hypothetical protein
MTSTHADAEFGPNLVLFAGVRTGVAHSWSRQLHGREAKQVALVLAPPDPLLARLQSHINGPWTTTIRHHWTDSQRVPA